VFDKVIRNGKVVKVLQVAIFPAVLTAAVTEYHWFTAGNACFFK
jgi:hypothetical protein